VPRVTWRLGEGGSRAQGAPECARAKLRPSIAVCSPCGGLLRARCEQQAFRLQGSHHNQRSRLPFTDDQPRDTLRLCSRIESWAGRFHVGHEDANHVHRAGRLWWAGPAAPAAPAAAFQSPRPWDVDALLLRTERLPSQRRSSTDAGRCSCSGLRRCRSPAPR
jgi:hypothetical protein